MSFLSCHLVFCNFSHVISLMSFLSFHFSHDISLLSFGLLPFLSCHFSQCHFTLVILSPLISLLSFPSCSVLTPLIPLLSCHISPATSPLARRSSRCRSSRERPGWWRPPGRRLGERSTGGAGCSAGRSPSRRRGSPLGGRQSCRLILPSYTNICTTTHMQEDPTPVFFSWA